MFLVKKGERNELVVSVYANSILTNPTYLFVFTHIVSKEQAIFIPQDISINKLRYNEFVFFESIYENLNVSPPRVTFPYDGQYYYEIYEQVSTTNLNPLLALNKVAEGRGLIEDLCVPDSYYEYISPNEVNENYVFISDDEQPACEDFLLTEAPEFILTEQNLLLQYDYE
jgi:hypothetical protein